MLLNLHYLLKHARTYAFGEPRLSSGVRGPRRTILLAARLFLIANLGRRTRFTRVTKPPTLVRRALLTESS